MERKSTKSLLMVLALVGMFGLVGQAWAVDTDGDGAGDIALRLQQPANRFSSLFRSYRRSRHHPTSYSPYLCLRLPAYDHSRESGTSSHAPSCWIDC